MLASLAGGAAALIAFNACVAFLPGRTEGYALALGCAMLASMCTSMFLVSSMTVMQLSVPDGLRDRVMGIHSICFSLIPLGGLLAGAVASATSPPLRRRPQRLRARGSRRARRRDPARHPAARRRRGGLIRCTPKAAAPSRRGAAGRLTRGRPAHRIRRTSAFVEPARPIGPPVRGSRSMERTPTPAAAHVRGAGHGLDRDRHKSHGAAAAGLAMRRPIDSFGAHPG